MTTANSAALPFNQVKVSDSAKTVIAKASKVVKPAAAAVPQPAAETIKTSDGKVFTSYREAMAHEQALNRQLTAERDARAQGKLTLKVSRKGCISIYGAKRFPISEYAPTLLKLFAIQKEIEALIARGKAGEVFTGSDKDGTYSVRMSFTKGEDVSA